MEKRLSIIIPTYTGAYTLSSVLESIRVQKNIELIEVIIIVDGPNKEIKKILDRYSQKHKKSFQSLIIKYLKSNKGRFNARLQGAMLAKNEQLVFIDDRTELKNNYIEVIGDLFKKNQAIISNVIEKTQPNFVSKTLYFIRKKLYKNWGENFLSYSITMENFDKVPKGTAGLGIAKELFIQATKEFIDEGNSTKESNDDTRLLKLIVNKNSLLRSPDPVLFYTPREHWIDELMHIYKRGPMFVDYYFKKGSPYFWHLIILSILTVVAIILTLIFPQIIIYLLLIVSGLILIGAIMVGASIKDKLQVFFGAILICLFFVLGIYVGMYNKALALKK